eukprot:CAMPEP_0185830952 /NCGR_PEP_ID=MMETSP1353-20130828/1185_1 /TAXON_ID=1077150 /ORGANISM="Erythrolobus australicus, Strain CCMP3124" /LENGTH=76 /DNA_ID=CAMNT_0028528949 /DNA_START=1205 /DNA_END=1431 /DNA_ORIENTATION=-
MSSPSLNVLLDSARRASRTQPSTPPPSLSDASPSPSRLPSATASSSLRASVHPRARAESQPSSPRSLTDHQQQQQP